VRKVLAATQHRLLDEVSTEGAKGAEQTGGMNLGWACFAHTFHGNGRKNTEQLAESESVDLLKLEPDAY
jgi:hypothetical protein